MIKAYLILIGFVSAFAITDLAPIPIILAGFIFLTLFIRLSTKGHLINPIPASIIFVYLSLGAMYVLGLLFTSGNLDTGINHVMAYIGVIILYHLVISFGLVNSPEIDVNKFISKGVILVAVITIVEFVSKNFFSIDFDSLIYRPSVREYNPIYNFGSSFFYRARGTMEESGYTALYLLMFLPFLYDYYNKVGIKSRLYFYILLTLIAVFFTFSAIGFVEGFIALIICLTIYLLFEKKIYKEKLKIHIKYIILAHFSVAALIIMTFSSKLWQTTFFENIIKKITFSDEFNITGSRQDRWQLAWDLIQQKPFFGWGPAYTSSVHGTGSTSLYIETAVSYGLLGLLLILLVFIFYFKRILTINGNQKYAYLFALLVALIHYSIISTIWFPWLWTLFALVDYKMHLQKNGNSL
jgi:hypothetical protein